MKRCWANILGGCSAASSKEHYVGKKLFGEKTVTTHGIAAELDGRSLPVKNLEAHILCSTHNNALSAVDNEAIKLRTAMDKWFQDEDMEDLLKGDSLWVPRQYRIKGLLFGRWLCKVHCNMLSLNNVDPPEYYVRSAFGESTEPSLRFHFGTQTGMTMSMQDRISYRNFLGGPCKEDEYGTFYLYFMGIHILVCPYDLTPMIQAKLVDSTGSPFWRVGWMNRLRKMERQQHGIVVKTLLFDWDD